MVYCGRPPVREGPERYSYGEVVVDPVAALSVVAVAELVVVVTVVLVDGEVVV